MEKTGHLKQEDKEMVCKWAADMLGVPPTLIKKIQTDFIMVAEPGSSCQNREGMGCRETVY